MYTNKEINTIKGLFFAASRAAPSSDLEIYRSTFDGALNLYFSSYPNDDENDDTYSAGDFPEFE